MDTNTITIPVPWLPMLIGLGVMGVGFGIRSIRDRSRAKVFVREARRRERIDSLFPFPWNDAYDECSEIYENPESRGFLRKWLADAKREGLDLPVLSSEQVRLFAGVLTFPENEWSDDRNTALWQECLDILAPYDNGRILADAVTREREASEKLRVAEEKAANLMKKQALFEYPWEKAYNACRTTDTFSAAQCWLRKWISEQRDLPALSSEAVEELIDHLAEEDSPDEKVCLELLSPYLDTDCFDIYRNVSDWNLRDQLPTEWYDFWQALKNYPACKMLFAKLIGKYEKDGFMVHAATQIPLTSDEANLLSRALGRGNAVDTEFYAFDLADFVRTESEVPLVRDHRNQGNAPAFHQNAGLNEG